MKILHIVPSIVERSDGVAYFVRELAKNQALNNNKVTILTTESDSLVDYEFEVLVFKSNRFFESVRFSLRFFLWLRSNILKFDIIHNHGMWMAPNISFMFFKSPRTVFSPHGTMSKEALKRSKFKKLIFWELFQKKAVLKSTLIHVTSIKERKEVQYKLKNRFTPTVIPIGINLNSININKRIQKENSIVFIGRIHPVKQIKELIEAWSFIEPRYNSWELKIIGPTNNQYARECFKKVDAKNLKRIHFLGELIGEEKYKEIQKSRVSILPSLTENFGVSALESLALGVPVIASENTPWVSLEKENCGWIISPTIDGIYLGICKAISDIENGLDDYSINTKKLVHNSFGWEKIQDEMQKFYNSK